MGDVACRAICLTRRLLAGGLGHPTRVVCRWRDRGNVRVGRELQVSSVVAGRIEEISGRLVVSAELVNARDNTQIWGNRYEIDRADLFAVQQSIAGEIARTLRLQLGGREQQLLTKRHTSDPRAC